MSIYNYININFINPLQCIPAQWYYSIKKNYSPISSVSRNHHIIVSLTSFPSRFSTIHYTLKSLLNQKMMPDLIILWLSKEEAKDISELPASITELQKYGIQIAFVDDDLKPHKKYYYAMQNYPNSTIITVDDDVIYDKNLVSDLVASYRKYPDAVSARRVHKITKDENNHLLPYSKWLYEYQKETEPSFALFTTGVGGVLYPPGILPPETFDLEKIKKLCLYADDVWLKCMEIKKNIPVVWVKSRRVHPLTILKAQKFSLQKSNFHKNMNDTYIENVQNHYGIKL